MSAAARKKLDFSKLVFKEAFFVEFCIKNTTIPYPPIGSIKRFNCIISTENSFSVEQQVIKVALHIECQAMNAQSNPTGIEGDFRLGFTFVVPNIEEYLVKSKVSGEMILGLQILIPLLATAYSTARGMLITKTLGTPLEGFALPIVNVQDLLKDKPKRNSTHTTGKLEGEAQFIKEPCCSGLCHQRLWFVRVLHGSGNQKEVSLNANQAL